MLDSFGDQNLFIFPTEIHVVSLRSLHTIDNFGYYYYNDSIAFKTSS